MVIEAHIWHCSLISALQFCYRQFNSSYAIYVQLYVYKVYVRNLP